MIQQIKDILFSDNLDELVTLAQSDVTSNYICMLQCTGGSMQITLNDANYVVNNNDLLVCLRSFFQGKYMRSPEFESRILCISMDFFKDIVIDCLRGEPKWLEKEQYFSTNPIISLNEYQHDLLDSYFNLLQVHLRGEQNTYRREILRSVARAATLEFLSYLDDALVKDQTNENIPQLSQKDSLIRSFFDLLRNPDTGRREVQWYAEQLSITPKYLSSVCKERTGKTASEWISDFTKDEIRRLLLHTDMTVKEVAFRMGFGDVSFFCQYVRKHFGMSPRALRNGGAAQD